MYPASFIPELTITSAIPRICVSLIFAWNTFQLFQPIGGVFTRSLICAKEAALIRATPAKIIFPEPAISTPYRLFLIPAKRGPQKESDRIHRIAEVISIFLSQLNLSFFFVFLPARTPLSLTK